MASEGVKAEEDGADHVGAGSVFLSSTKPEERFLGVEGLKQLVGLGWREGTFGEHTSLSHKVR